MRSPGIVNLTRSSEPSCPLSLERGQPYRRAKDFFAPNRRATDGSRIPPLLKLTMPASALSGGHAEGPLDAFGKASRHQAVATGATRCTGQAIGARGRALCLGAKPRPRRPGAGDAAAAVEAVVDAAETALDAARDQSRTAWRLVTIEIAADSATFSYRLDRTPASSTRALTTANASKSP
jgi:hypothetical protein